MVRFLSELSVTPIRADRWRLDADLVVDSDYGRIVVPCGFVTDGASVPRPLWNIYPPMDGDYDPAAVIHDYAYQLAGTDLRHQIGIELNRGQADGLLRDGMVATNTAAWKRRAIYAGVRIGGWLPWRREREKETQKT